MTRFDKAINNALIKKIERAKKKNRHKYDRVRPPNTPGNRPVSNCSPALQKGIDQEIAQSPTDGVGS